MKFRILISLAVLAAVVAVAYADAPTFGRFRQSYSGAVVSFIAAAKGTNTSVEVVYEGEIPWRLAEVTTTATTVTVSRVWQHEVPVMQVDVSTNLFGVVETNSYISGSQITTVTNLIYTSGVTTLPVYTYFVQGDMMVVDFDGETNKIVRILGTAQ
jgi:hypothetical protein